MREDLKNKLLELFKQGGWEITQYEGYFPDAHTNREHSNCGLFTGEGWVFYKGAATVTVYKLKDGLTVDFVDSNFAYGKDFKYSEVEKIYTSAEEGYKELQLEEGI